ncbi:MAG TPA: hypothetical protein ENN42_05270 [Thioalkalivibrio sp.]|nr:hypothetical protein [Thioalkalivibrio sp.]
MTPVQWRTLTAACLIVAGILNAAAALGFGLAGLLTQWAVSGNAGFWYDLWEQLGGEAVRTQAEAVGAWIGRVLVYWALLLALSAPLLVAGGIQCARGRMPGLVAAAGYTGFVLELLGMAVSGVGVLHLPGLAAGPLVFVTLRRMREP